MSSADAAGAAGSCGASGVHAATPSAAINASCKARLMALASVVLVREREIAELRRAVLGLDDRVVLVLAAIPVMNAQALVVVRQLQIGVFRVPRLRERRRIVDPDVRDERLLVDLLPDFDGLDLLRVLGLRALILAAAQRVRVD